MNGEGVVGAGRSVPGSGYSISKGLEMRISRKMNNTDIVPTAVWNLEG